MGEAIIHTLANVGLTVTARDVIAAKVAQESSGTVTVRVRRRRAGQRDVVRVRNARAHCVLAGDVCDWGVRNSGCRSMKRSFTVLGAKLCPFDARGNPGVERYRFFLSLSARISCAQAHVRVVPFTPLSKKGTQAPHAYTSVRNADGVEPIAWQRSKTAGPVAPRVLCSGARDRANTIGDRRARCVWRWWCVCVRVGGCVYFMVCVFVRVRTYVCVHGG